MCCASCIIFTFSMASFLRLQFFFFGFRHHCRRRHRRWYNYCISMSICLYSILLSVMYLPCEQNAMIIGIIYSLISSSLKYVWAFQVLCFVNRMAKLAKRFANTLWLYHLSTHTHSSNTLSSQPWSLSLSLSLRAKHLDQSHLFVVVAVHPFDYWNQWGER